MRGKKKFAFLFGRLVLFTFDLITDIIVAIEYRRKGDTWWFALTLCFILLPLFIVSCIVFYQIAAAAEADGITTKHVTVSAFLTALLLSIFLRFLHEFMRWKQTYWDNRPCGENYKACNCAECKQHRRKLKVSNTSTYNLAWIHYVETMLESAPQWCLQVYIMLRQWNFPWYTLLSVIFSFLSLAWSITALKRATATKDNSDLKLRYTVLYFFYQLFGLFSRLFAIVIFAYVFKMYILFVFGLHLLVVSVVLQCAGSERIECCKGSGQCIEICRRCIYSFPFFFHPSKAVLKSLGINTGAPYLIAYGAIFVENLIMTITAVIRLRSGVAHLGLLRPIALSFVTIGLVLNAVLSVLYYFKYNKPIEEPPSLALSYENEEAQSTV